MSQEFHDLTGKVEITLTDVSGRVIDNRCVHNTIVNTGREMVARLFADQGGEKTVKVGVGTLGDVVNETHTLAERFFVARADIADVAINAVLKRVKLSFAATFGQGEAVDKLREAGVIFEDGNSSELDVLYNGVTFSTIDKKTSDVLTLKWEITF